MQNEFSSDELEIFSKRNIPLSKIEEQISFLKDGFPFLKISNTATTEKGITRVEQTDINTYLNIWDTYLMNTNPRVFKFVPASGAASRMFKNLFEFLDEISDLPESDFLKTFFINIHKFAFFDKLNKKCLSIYDKDIDTLIQDNQFKQIIQSLLLPNGLNYGNLPKGLLEFHHYPQGNRTPFEEQLVESTMYIRDCNKSVNIHFTVSPEHKKLFEDLSNQIKADFEKKYDSKINISFSEQKPQTDTIAVNMDNTPFREHGKLLFRPAGHGALIENLNDIDADIIFIKNIDNIVPDRLKENESKYKKLLAGYLIYIQTKIFKYLHQIDSGVYTQNDLLDILYFTQNELNTKNPEIKLLEDAELVLYLKEKLNRPIRVCGMVQNIGEAGGGPFFVKNQDDTISLQILESTQINTEDPTYKAMFEEGTHFNPVDLVCSIKNYMGQKFDLRKYVDKNTGFISYKSKNGKTLKALELPGLWNGSMSDWNTIFIELPLETFNPVKTVNDLLRKEHQND